MGSISPSLDCREKNCVQQDLDGGLVGAFVMCGDGGGDSMDSSGGFLEWLRSNTDLSEGSAVLYDRTIRRFLREFEGHTSTIDINRFITESFRNNASYYVKYAFKHYLNYTKQKSYDDLVKVKIGAKKRMGKYVSEAKIKEIIENIKNETHKDIAIIQYGTGARAREIITLSWDNIDYEPNRIRIRLIGKGNKQRFTYLNKELDVVLKRHVGVGEYLFLPSQFASYNQALFEKKVQTQRSYYYKSISQAAQLSGLDRFGTHDFRRNVAEMLRKKISDPYIVQRVLGHADIRTTMLYYQESPEEVAEAIMSHQRGDN